MSLVSALPTVCTPPCSTQRGHLPLSRSHPFTSHFPCHSQRRHRAADVAFATLESVAVGYILVLVTACASAVYLRNPSLSRSTIDHVRRCTEGIEKESVHSDLDPGPCLL
jgi:hypothetical protein